MKINCIVDNKCFTDKPEGKEVGGIINRMTIDKNDDYSIEDLKKKILLGNTVRPSNCGGKEDSWKSQQIFMIDIDDNLTIDDAIDICKKKDILPNFIYTSFSHTEEHHKFRLVFVLDKEITNYDIAKKIQLYLMAEIGEVDKQCKNLNRIYFAGRSIVFDSGNVLNSDELIELSNDIQIDIPKDNRGLKAEKPIIIKQEGNIDYIKTLDVEGLQGILRKGWLIDKYIEYCSISHPKTPLQIVTNRNELYDAINKIDLIEFLGLDSNKFNCIFHDDNNPSAGIFINPETGHYIYKCFSSNCKFPAGTIIRCVERLAKCNKPKAINFIKAVYGIELIESDWQKEQKEILQANIDYLLSGKMEEEFPELHKRIRNYVPILITLHNIAMNNVKDENIIDSKDVAFFTSKTNIQKEMNTNNGKISERINLFAFLELIYKLDESQIPEYLLKKSKHIAAKNKQRYLVNYYSIPSYSDEKLNSADDLAILFKEKGMTMKGWSRELLLRTFGQELTNKVYPQFKDVGISKTSYKFEKKFIKVLFSLLDKQGYVTEKQCLEMLKGYKEANHTKMKRMLPEILDNYSLQRIRANKKIKEQFGVVSNGYPFIIVRG